MSSRSAIDSVVLTDDFRAELRRQRLRLRHDGTARRTGDRELSRAGFAALLSDCDASTIAKWEKGPTKSIARDAVERLTGVELESDKGRLFKSLGILPRDAETSLSRFRLAVGSSGLPRTAAEVRRLEAGMIGEALYSTATIQIPVPDRVLTTIGRINRRTYAPPEDLGPETPLVAFRDTGALRRAAADTDIRIGLRSDAANAVHQFALAHATAHRVLGHRVCEYRPLASVRSLGDGPSLELPEPELMTNDLAVRLLSPTIAVRRAYSNAVAAITRSKGRQPDLWEVEQLEDAGEPPAWTAIVTSVAKELNIPGWLAMRRITEERLMDWPMTTSAST